MAEVVFLYGNDEYAISRRLKELGAIFPDATSAEMNTAHLDARTVSEDELNMAVNAAPFLASRRLVSLANPSARYVRPEERKHLESFVGKAPETVLLVLYDLVETRYYRDRARQEKEDGKLWLVRWGKKAGYLVERHALPAAWEMTGWIIREAERQGGEIGTAAAAGLAELVGTDTRQAGQEVAKLLAYAGWGRPVTVADVRALSPLVAGESVFEFVDALANGDRKVAQRLLHRLLESEDPFALWGMVIRQFRLLLLAREVLEAREGKAEVAQALEVHPFVAEKASAQARAFSLARLERIYRQMAEIDEAVKTSQLTLELALDLLVADLARA